MCWDLGGDESKTSASNTMGPLADCPCETVAAYGIDLYQQLGAWTVEELPTSTLPTAATWYTISRESADHLCADDENAEWSLVIDNRLLLRFKKNVDAGISYPYLIIHLL